MIRSGPDFPHDHSILNSPGANSSISSGGRLGRALFVRLKRLWVVLFVLASTVFLVRYLALHWEHAAIPNGLVVWAIMLACCLQFVFWFIYSAAWRWLVCSLSPMRLSRLGAFQQTVLIAFGKYLPGKIWGLVARGARLHDQGMPVTVTARITLHEQLLFVTAAVVVSLLAAVPPASPALKIILGMSAILVVWLGMIMQPIVHGLAYRIMSRVSPATIDHGQPLRLPFRDYARFLLQYALAWTVAGLVFVAVFYAFFGSPLRSDLVALLVLANTVAHVAGFAAIFAPAGIGVREATAAGILATAIPFGDALAVSLLHRVLMVIVEVLSGATLFIGGSSIKDTRRRHSKT